MCPLLPPPHANHHVTTLTCHLPHVICYVSLPHEYHVALPWHATYHVIILRCHHATTSLGFRYLIIFVSNWTIPKIHVFSEWLSWHHSPLRIWISTFQVFYCIEGLLFGLLNTRNLERSSSLISLTPVAPHVGGLLILSAPTLIPITELTF